MNEAAARKARSEAALAAEQQAAKREAALVRQVVHVVDGEHLSV